MSEYSYIASIFIGCICGIIISSFSNLFDKKIKTNKMGSDTEENTYEYNRIPYKSYFFWLCFIISFIAIIIRNEKLIIYLLSLLFSSIICTFINCVIQYIFKRKSSHKIFNEIIISNENKKENNLDNYYDIYNLTNSVKQEDYENIFNSEKKEFIYNNNKEESINNSDFDSDCCINQDSIILDELDEDIKKNYKFLTECLGKGSVKIISNNKLLIDISDRQQEMTRSQLEKFSNMHNEFIAEKYKLMSRVNSDDSSIFIHHNDESSLSNNLSESSNIINNEELSDDFDKINKIYDLNNLHDELYGFIKKTDSKISLDQNKITIKFNFNNNSHEINIETTNRDINSTQEQSSFLVNHNIYFPDNGIKSNIFNANKNTIINYVMEEINNKNKYKLMEALDEIMDIADNIEDYE